MEGHKRFQITIGDREPPSVLNLTSPQFGLPAELVGPLVIEEQAESDSASPRMLACNVDLDAAVTPEDAQDLSQDVRYRSDGAIAAVNYRTEA